VRVEWSKARARRDRWVEEVQKLREEMKRVLRMLRCTQGEWRTRAEAQRQVDAELAAGLKGYAMRQVAIHRQVADAFHTGWNVSVATAVRDVVRQDGTVYRELLDGQAMDRAFVGGGVDKLEENDGGPTRTTRRSGRGECAEENRNSEGSSQHTRKGNHAEGVEEGGSTRRARRG
jgi:hypothetical protein